MLIPWRPSLPSQSHSQKLKPLLFHPFCACLDIACRQQKDQNYYAWRCDLYVMRAGCLRIKAWTFPLLWASVWILGGPTLRVPSFMISFSFSSDFDFLEFNLLQFHGINWVLHCPSRFSGQHHLTSSRKPRDSVVSTVQVIVFEKYPVECTFEQFRHIENLKRSSFGIWLTSWFAFQTSDIIWWGLLDQMC